MKRLLAIGLIWFVPGVCSSTHADGEPHRDGGLSFEERLACQQAIEEVYWHHRSWPAWNPTPKPPLRDVLAPGQLHRKVEDTLLRSKVLAERWSRPVTGEQLQRELQRMAADTRQPELLKELFAALGDSPLAIAECLARPVLTSRLIRDWYENDADSDLIGDPDVPTFDDWWREQRADAGLGGDGSTATDASSDRFSAFAIPSYGYDAPAVDGSSCGAEGWSATHVEAPDRRRNHTAVWTGTEMIIWGGENDDWLSSGGRYTPATDTWEPTSIQSGVPSPRNFHSAVWTGNEMIVWGGQGPIGATSTELADGARYDPVADSWSPISTDQSPPARSDHSAIWTGSEMIVWGGRGNSVYLGDGGRYEPSTDSWLDLPAGGTAPTGRADHSVVWTGSEMVIWGGIGDLSLTSTGARYDPSTDAWTPTSSINAPALRRYHSAVWTGNEMVVWGGSGFINDLSTGGRYDPLGDSWSPTSGSAAPSRRSQHSAVWTGSRMIVWGGSGSGTLNSGGQYDAAADSWSPVTLLGAPTPRTAHTAVWNGSEMIVWGGIGNDLQPGGGRYDPNSNSWVPVSGGATVPAERGRHGAVWTGTEMIVWGGHGYGPLNSGGRYDAATDSWTPTSITAGTPSPREEFGTIWTGTEMIVWGGRDGMGAEFATGARYDPLGDSWIPTSTSGAPVARHDLTAVWTGTEMIVWGGSPVTMTGGKYDPASDSWTPTSTGAGVPAARFGHSVVWTGTEMIVWGGKDPTDPIDTGARYDPSTNTWTPTSTSGAPAPRRHQTAVWIGGEMIVWGGDSGSNRLNSGGRYDPATDSWIDTSLTDAPAGRTRHTAVWTGIDMLVYAGGDGSGQALRTGGRYDPTTDSWASTPSDPPAPAGRSYHTALWTEADGTMIVWGGAEATATGGIFCPTESTGSGPGRVPDGGSISGAPLELVKNATVPTDLNLSWSESCTAGATDYSIHEGLLGSWYSHSSHSCTTGATLSATITPAGGNRYYLVVPLDGADEGSYGADSTGNPRPSSSVTCRASQRVEPCP